MACIKKITVPIVYDCDNKPIAGLETRALMANRADIDFAAIVRSADGTTITNLPMIGAAVGFPIDDIKNLNNANSEFVKGEMDNAHKHSFLGRIFNLDPASLVTVNALADGAEVVIIVESKYKGTDQASAFKIFGLDVGLTMQEGKYGSGENKGVYTFTVGSEDGYEEPKALYFWLEGAASPGTYAETKTRFDAALA